MKHSPPSAPGATSTWFGDDQNPLLGWYHAAQGKSQGCGVVLCAPFGHEYLVAYRAYRKLAEALSAAGFPTLFFDFDGCGDSADSDAPRIATWQRNITQAMAELKLHAGVAQVALFGVRLGAMLAASIAAQTPVAALALVAPVISGRGYARELVAFGRLSPIPPSPDPLRAVLDDEIAGYPFSKETQADLGKLNLLKTTLSQDTPVFISTSDDVTGREDKLLEVLRSSGMDVTVSTSGGYAAMMAADAYKSQVPMALWMELVDWMRAKCATADVIVPDGAPSAQAALRRAAMPVQGHWVHEELVQFDGLSGVLTEPATPVRTPVTVLLNNTGSGHRVSNHRLNVQLARALALQGFRVLRLDRAGMGYSRATPQGLENEVYAEAGVADMRSAMDFLQQAHGCTAFVLAGLCSGAYFSYKVAAVDSRVQSLIMINPLTFQWHEGDSLEVRVARSFKSSGFYLRNAGKLQTWHRLLRGDVAIHRIAAKLVERGLTRLRHHVLAGIRNLGFTGVWAQPVARNFLRMAKRRVDLVFILSADDAAMDVVAAELGPKAQILGHYPGLRVEVVDNTDHTFTPRWSQKLLIDLITQHLLTRFGN